MDDLGQGLRETLERHAADAPGATGLAAAARGRARRRRRTRVGLVVAAVVVTVAVPSAVATWPRPAAEIRPAPAVGRDDSLRWESWHGVSVQVPDDWGFGSLSAWCASDGELTPRVERPGGDTPAVGCTPASAYGLTFQAVDGGDSSWPVVHQDGGGWPAENAVGGRTLDGVLITVAAPSAAEAQAVLDSARVVDGEDPLGCSDQSGRRPSVVVGTVTVCRYDAGGDLEQSEVLAGADAADAEAALAGMPVVDLDCRPPAGVQTVRLRSADIDAEIVLAPGCTAATPDVLYWALSPGFSGDAWGLPLPPRLREE